jgi:hypothetical protein
MKMMTPSRNDLYVPDKWIPGLGYLQRNGTNFLPAIVRLEEILSGTLKA